MYLRCSSRLLGSKKFQNYRLILGGQSWLEAVRFQDILEVVHHPLKGIIEFNHSQIEQIISCIFMYHVTKFRGSCITGYLYVENP